MADIRQYFGGAAAFAQNFMDPREMPAPTAFAQNFMDPREMNSVDSPDMKRLKKCNSKEKLDSSVGHEYEDLARLIWDTVDSEKKTFSIPLNSIYSIDGVRCLGNLSVTPYDDRTYSNLLLYKYSFVAVEVNTNRCRNDDDTDEEDDEYNTHSYIEKKIMSARSYDSIVIALREIFEEIALLKYNPLTCKFNNNRDYQIHKSNAKAITFAFKDTANVVLFDDECSICMETTRCKTRCNHSLCVRCADKTMLTNRTSYGNTEAKCPMCRKSGIDQLTISL